MYTHKYVTAEFVTPKHPDKQCDIIADTLLDAFYAQDKESRVAIEVMGGHDLFTINGEVTSTAIVDVESIVHGLVGETPRVIVNLVKQSPEIARGVDTGGAGDQGIMNGYATRTTESLLPYAYDRARALCMHLYQFYPYDGKVQITVDGLVVKTVVASFQHASHDELLQHTRDFIESEEYIINYTGDWDIGGFDADTGLSGRKIVIDNYGPTIPVGGGSFSGKDYTKVDRSGAYMARKVAVDYLRKHASAEEVFVQIAYAIGKAEPVQAIAYIDGVPESVIGYDLSPRGIREILRLDTVHYKDTATWGHFGRGFAWDKS
jgi:S-adenosylmethionine synthetase